MAGDRKKFEISMKMTGTKLAGKQAKTLSTQTTRAATSMNSLSNATGALKKLLPTIGLAVVARQFAMWTKEIAAAGDELGKMSKRTGITVEDLSRLGYAAEISGTALGPLKDALRYLAKNLNDASQGIGIGKRAFDKFNIAVVDSDGHLRDTKDVLLEVADMMVNMGNATQRSATAADIFGARFGEKLMPLLLEGSKGIKKLADESDRLGLTWSMRDAVAAEEFTDAMLRVSKSMDAIKRSLIMGLMPAMTSFTDDLVQKTATITASMEKLVRWARIAMLLQRGVGFPFQTGGPGVVGGFKAAYDIYRGVGEYSPIGKGYFDFLKPGGGGADPTGGPASIIGGGKGAGLKLKMVPVVSPDTGRTFLMPYDEARNLIVALRKQDLPISGVVSGGMGDPFLVQGGVPPGQKAKESMIDLIAYSGQAQNSAMMMADSFANAFAMMSSGAAGVGDAISKSLLGALGQIAIMWGRYFMAMGFAAMTIPGGQIMWGAVAKGAALIALGGTISGLAGGMGRGGGGNLGSGFSPSGPGGGPVQTGGSQIIIINNGRAALAAGGTASRMIDEAVEDRVLAARIKRMIDTGETFSIT